MCREATIELKCFLTHAFDVLGGYASKVFAYLTHRQAFPWAELLFRIISVVTFSW